MREIRISDHQIDPDWIQRTTDVLRQSPYLWKCWRDTSTLEIVVSIDMPINAELPIEIPGSGDAA